MANNIIWRKWQDPLAPLVNGKPAKTYEQEEDEESPDYQKARHSFGEDKAPRITKGKGFVGPAILGPHGIVPLHESNIPSALFNFWMGDTDFDLTKQVAKTISATPGVETLDIITRYRFRVGIGRSFAEQRVKGLIEKVLNPNPPVVAIAALAKDPRANIKKMLAKKFSHWAIFVMPNGRVEVAGGSSAEEVNEKGKAYQAEAQETILSWETK
jgi:hypothetical protein